MLVLPTAGADPGIKQRGRMASAGARAYNGGLGAGVQGQSSWSGDQGAKPP